MLIVADGEQPLAAVELERTLVPSRDLHLTEPGIALGRGGEGSVALLVGPLNAPGHLHWKRLGVDEHEPVAAQVQRANGGVVALLRSGRDGAASRRAGRPFTIASED